MINISDKLTAKTMDGIVADSHQIQYEQGKTTQRGDTVADKITELEGKIGTVQTDLDGYVKYQQQTKTEVEKQTARDNIGAASTETVQALQEKDTAIDGEITSIKKWKIDTSSVTDMNSMFGDCTAITSLDLSSFDTSNVTDMNYMFGFCSSLTSLDLSGFNTSSVTDMGGMFEGCTALTSLTLTSSFFNSSEVTVFDFSGLASWTETTSLEQFVNAISSKDGTGKTVKLSDATKTALTDAQKKQIRDAKWTIA